VQSDSLKSIQPAAASSPAKDAGSQAEEISASAVASVPKKKSQKRKPLAGGTSIEKDEFGAGEEKPQHPEMRSALAEIGTTREELGKLPERFNLFVRYCRKNLETGPEENVAAYARTLEAKRGGADAATLLTFAKKHPAHTVSKFINANSTLTKLRDDHRKEENKKRKSVANTKSAATFVDDSQHGSEDEFGAGEEKFKNHEMQAALREIKATRAELGKRFMRFYKYCGEHLESGLKENVDAYSKKVEELKSRGLYAAAMRIFAGNHRELEISKIILDNPTLKTMQDAHVAAVAKKYRDSKEKIGQSVIDNLSENSSDNAMSMQADVLPGAASPDNNMDVDTGDFFAEKEGQGWQGDMPPRRAKGAEASPHSAVSSAKRPRVRDSTRASLGAVGPKSAASRKKSPPRKRRSRAGASASMVSPRVQPKKGEEPSFFRDSPFLQENTLRPQESLFDEGVNDYDVGSSIFQGDDARSWFTESMSREEGEPIEGVDVPGMSSNPGVRKNVFLSEAPSGWEPTGAQQASAQTRFKANTADEQFEEFAFVPSSLLGSPASEEPPVASPSAGSVSEKGVPDSPSGYSSAKIAGLTPPVSQTPRSPRGGGGRGSGS
jgi:hypothetical protein